MTTHENKNNIELQIPSECIYIYTWYILEYPCDFKTLEIWTNTEPNTKPISKRSYAHCTKQPPGSIMEGFGDGPCYPTMYCTGSRSQQWSARWEGWLYLSICPGDAVPGLVVNSVEAPRYRDESLVDLNWNRMAKLPHLGHPCGNDKNGRVWCRVWWAYWVKSNFEQWRPTKDDESDVIKNSSKSNENDQWALTRSGWIDAQMCWTPENLHLTCLRAKTVWKGPGSPSSNARNAPYFFHHHPFPPLRQY